MKKQSNLSRLMGYAGGHKILTYLSWVLSVMSALLALVPFWYIWCIIHDILEVSPDFSQAENVTGYGWSAVLFAVISIVVYIAALMCSHLSAFRVAANIRKELMRHIAALPLGVTEKYGSGKLRRIVNGSSAATETYLAHRLPDKAGAIATPIGLLFLLLAFDWRLGLLSLVPVVLGFLIMMKMTGKDMEKRMEQYQNALADMSNEAVEYVRGVPVVKTFGQTIFSFKRFKNAIDNYETWVIAYTKGLRLPIQFCSDFLFRLLYLLGQGFTLLAFEKPLCVCKLRFQFRENIVLQTADFPCALLRLYHQIFHASKFRHIHIQRRLGRHILFSDKALQKLLCPADNAAEQGRQPALFFNGLTCLLVDFLFLDFQYLCFLNPR